MPTATTLQPSPTPGLGTPSTAAMMSSPASSAATAKPPLRRAVYVHVSDLLSAYNIDHAKLEEELQRVRRGATTPSPPPPANAAGVPTELDTTVVTKKLQPPRGGFNLCVYVCDSNILYFHVSGCGVSKPVFLPKYHFLGISLFLSLSWWDN